MRDSIRHFLSEFIGTFALTFVGSAAIMQTAPGGGNVVAVALAAGLVLAIFVSAFMHIGAHFNPAVTIGMLVVRRIGTRTRNAKLGTPTAAEKEALLRLSPAAPSFAGMLDGKQAYMRAIFINPPICFGCHGKPEELKPEVTAALARLYPNDQATGYQKGELRGAFVVSAARP